jgi:hypothetical protein
MQADQQSAPNALDKVHAEAYRSYLRSLKEGFSHLDVEALDLSHVRASLPHQNTAMFCCCMYPTAKNPGSSSGGQTE